MTAIFMARSDAGIVAAADAAFYDNSGKLTFLNSKLTLMPEHDCVITLQGPFFYHPEIKANLFCKTGGFDDVLQEITGVMRDIHAKHANAYGFSRAFVALIGGYSKSRQAWETYWLHSEPGKEGANLPRHEPWVIRRARATEWAPGYEAEAGSLAGFDPEKPLSEQGMNVEEVAIRTICAARAQPIPIGDDPNNGTCQVGGYIQFARVEQRLITTSIAHSWPDPLGERLDPACGDLVPSYLQLARQNDPDASQPENHDA
ncbi:hypothetical protein [Methylobacterium indicum]|uniref:Uncharacterized protein n=1 Tax=Methylobacterium indicum TaxID=1775910 RepID=A0A8H8X109_9HYPH|nr:hypothetical protein [Methylobacterium indicum]BCM88094.1 hypothetical protein mvi_65550 [Methylobacterium indicum]